MVPSLAALAWRNPGAGFESEHVLMPKCLPGSGSRKSRELTGSTYPSRAFWLPFCVYCCCSVEPSTMAAGASFKVPLGLSCKVASDWSVNPEPLLGNVVGDPAARVRASQLLSGNVRAMHLLAISVLDY